jgi:hypothetical protein
MLRVAMIGLVIGVGHWASAGELDKGLNKTHGDIENTARQLSGAIDSLSHALGTQNRPIASAYDLTDATVLNGLKQLALDPARDPKQSFEALKNRHDRISKEFNTVVVEWVKNDSKKPEEKSEAVERALIKEREILRGQKKEIEDQIKEQIKMVMTKMSFSQVLPGSTTYQRNGEQVSVRFQDGQVIVSPIKPLPKVD